VALANDVRHLPERQVDRLLRIARLSSSKTHVFLAVTYNAALRLCEALHLRAGDLDKTTLQLNITPAKKRIAQGIWYQLNQEVSFLLSRWIALNELDPTDWMFPGRAKPCRVRSVGGPTRISFDVRRLREVSRSS